MTWDTTKTLHTLFLSYMTKLIEREALAVESKTDILGQ